jgi:hypothetical protein
MQRLSKAATLIHLPSSPTGAASTERILHP